MWAGFWFVSPLPGVWAWFSLVGLPVGMLVGSGLMFGGHLSFGCCLLLLSWGGGGGGGGGKAYAPFLCF